MNKKLILTAFIIVALVQLYVPAKMIIDRENVLKTGTTYKFLTAPVDPNDPFRGKYIDLDFQNNIVFVQHDSNWIRNAPVFLNLTTDTKGFARIKSVAQTRPEGTSDFIEARIRYVVKGDSDKLIIDFPFNRFYMEESKAPMAEIAYRASLIDTSVTTYALVKVKDGEAVLKDVFINDTSIQFIVNPKENFK